MRKIKLPNKVNVELETVFLYSEVANYPSIKGGLTKSEIEEACPDVSGHSDWAEIPEGSVFRVTSIKYDFERLRSNDE